MLSEIFFSNLWLVINKVMNGVQDITQGGAIIFATDGLQQCQGGPDSPDIDDEALIDRIIRTKLRIITVAFGLATHYLKNTI